MSFAEQLVAWYHLSGRHNLPWQHNPTPYRVWISEIMLQQTQVATVIPYYDKFMRRFVSLQDLAHADIDDVLAHWAGLGYYSRARNLHKTALKLFNEKDGTFPKTVAELEELPGIGRSTAGAILSFSMQIPAVILDGNVKRVLTRHFAIEGWPGKTTVHNKLWDIATKLTPKQNPHHFNQAIMDLGASLCSRSKPQCTLCPFTNSCKAYATDSVKQYPNSKPKTQKAFPQKDVMMLILCNEAGDVLLEKRPSYGIWGGLWSFPECDIQADIKQASLTLGFMVISTKKQDPFSHKFSHYQLNIQPQIIKVAPLGNHLNQGRETQWLTPQDALQKGIPSPIHQILSKLPAEPS